MHHRAKDLSGQTFGYLMALRYHGGNGKKSLWLFRCACGAEVVRVAGEVKRGKTKSCGCYRDRVQRERATTHGMSRAPQYAVWRSMLARCGNPKHPAWGNYGGRGITVCERWSSFEQFWADMGPTYQRGLDIDRRDNDGGYNASNCRWVTRKINSRNKRRSSRIDTPWGAMTVSEAAERSGIGRSTLWYRIDQGVPRDLLFVKPDVTNRFTTS